MFLKTFLMKKKKKKSGRGGDVDVLKHHHQEKSSICQNFSKRVVTGGRHQFVKTPQSGFVTGGRHLAIRTNSEISVTLQTGMKKMNNLHKVSFSPICCSNLLYQQ